MAASTSAMDEKVTKSSLSDLFTCRSPHYYICKFFSLLGPQTFFYSSKAQATDRVYGVIPFLCPSRTQTLQAAFSKGETSAEEHEPDSF